MRAGCGRAGDFAGDPLAWLAQELVVWIDAARLNVRAAWRTDPALPAGSTLVAYNAGAIVSHDAQSPADFGAAAAGTLPALAVAAVAPGVDSDGAYDPLGSDPTAANLTTEKSYFGKNLRGLYRVEDASLERYELYRGVDADPDLGAAPWQTFAALPFESPTLTPGHTYKFVLRKRNRYGLVSQNLRAWSVIVAVDGSAISPPTAPELAVAAVAAGAVLVSATYDYPQDDASIRADMWAVWLTSDGTEPNPANVPDYTVAMVQSDGVSKLAWTSGAFAHGTTVKALVRACRSDTFAESQNTASASAVADANGPAAPDASVFYGLTAKQGA